MYAPINVKVHNLIMFLFKVRLNLSLQNQYLLDIQKRMHEIRGEIRPIAVSFVDAFDFYDETLLSALGSYDGQVYSRLMQAAVKPPLNTESVPETTKRHILPFLKANV